MRGALLSALPKIKNEPVLIVSGNDIVEADAYRSVVTRAAQGRRRHPRKEDERVFPRRLPHDERNFRRGNCGKAQARKEPSKFVTIVAHAHNDPTVLLDALRDVDESRDDGYEQALQKLFHSHRYLAASYEGDWQAVKYPWHMIPLLELLLKDVKKPLKGKM